MFGVQVKDHHQNGVLDKLAPLGRTHPRYRFPFAGAFLPPLRLPFGHSFASSDSCEFVSEFRTDALSDTLEA